MKKVALIGLDGSGKSANIDIMKKDDDYSSFSFLWVRWKPTLLKPLYKAMGNRVKKGKKSEVVEEEQNAKNSVEQQELRDEYNKKKNLKKKIFSNPIVCALWIFLATVDYFFQFYGKVIGYLIRRKPLIFDRYYLDLYIDQGISFGYSPERIYKMVHHHQFLFPKMSKIIYIHVSPEICYARKDDIPNMDYLMKRYEVYENMAVKDKWTVINGENSLQEVNSDIKKKILGE